MANLLEVIVTSLEEARIAEAGGADRLELVRALDVGGLTPEPALVDAVVRAVTIPVRVMLRERPTLWISEPAELERLEAFARQFSTQRVGGFVFGFVSGAQVDLPAMRRLLSAAPAVPVTFHRAFDEVAEPLRAIADLKGLHRVDRILTAGGDGEWAERFARLKKWQAAASPEIKILVGAGLSPAVLDDLRTDPLLDEVHVGRVVRLPQSVTGSLDSESVRRTKSALA